MKSAWSGFHLTTKLSLIFTVLMLLAIPVTVLSMNSIRDTSSRAAGSLGDPNYPDPVVSWSKDPQYRITLCLNTTDRNSTLCNREIYINGSTSYTTNALDKFTYYYWVQILDHSNNWVDYKSGNWYNSCFLLTGGSLCEYKISWPQPTFTAQAVVSGTALKNACDGGITSCSSTKTTTYPSKSVQFVDLPPNINIDTYVKVGSILYFVVVSTPTGSTIITAAPNLSVPKYGELGVTVNNTPFAWTAVPGASYYALWVSTSPNFVSDGFWYKSVPSNACNTTTKS